MKRTTLFVQLLFLPVFLLCFAGAAVAGITLAWDANEETHVAGYRVYYQTNSATVPLAGNTALEGPSPIEVGDVLTFTLNGLDESQIHYFAVTAYDQNGTESTLSEIVASRWVPSAHAPEQDALVAPNRVSFQWTAPPSDARIIAYRLYYSTDAEQLATAVNNSSLAQAMGGSALAASVALLGVGLGRSGRRRNWLVMAMLAALVGAYGCGGGGGSDGEGSIQIPPGLEIPEGTIIPGDLQGIDDTSAVSMVTDLVDTYHSAFDLQPSTTYFWKVIAIDEHGQEFEGATYSFTTEAF